MKTNYIARMKNYVKQLESNVDENHRDNIVILSKIDHLKDQLALNRKQNKLTNQEIASVKKAISKYPK